MKTIQQKKIELPIAQQQNNTSQDILSSLVMNGDTSKLSPVQKVAYYKQVCDKLGLDPLSQPFKILKLDGREVLYCHRGGAQQLNKLHRVSHEVKVRETVSGCYVVTAQAATPDGRRTESIGAVPIHNLKGEALCNAMMKAETKAKRRATLDLLGLGMLDETEISATSLKNEQVIDLKQTEQTTNNKGAFPTSLFVSDKGLVKLVAQCNDEEELLVLYNDNKERIEQHPELRESFTERKLELRSSIAA